LPVSLVVLVPVWKEVVVTDWLWSSETSVVVAVENAVVVVV
jgi:hypothetical protein